MSDISFGIICASLGSAFTVGLSVLILWFRNNSDAFKKMKEDPDETDDAN